MLKRTLVLLAALVLFTAFTTAPADAQEIDDPDVEVIDIARYVVVGPRRIMLGDTVEYRFFAMSTAGDTVLIQGTLTTDDPDVLEVLPHTGNVVQAVAHAPGATRFRITDITLAFTSIKAFHGPVDELTPTWDQMAMSPDEAADSIRYTEIDQTRMLCGYYFRDGSVVGKHDARCPNPPGIALVVAPRPLVFRSVLPQWGASVKIAGSGSSLAIEDGVYVRSVGFDDNSAMRIGPTGVAGAALAALWLVPPALRKFRRA